MVSLRGEELSHDQQKLFVAAAVLVIITIKDTLAGMS